MGPSKPNTPEAQLGGDEPRHRGLDGVWASWRDLPQKGPVWAALVSAAPWGALCILAWRVAVGRGIQSLVKQLHPLGQLQGRARSTCLILIYLTGIKAGPSPIFFFKPFKPLIPHCASTCFVARGPRRICVHLHASWPGASVDLLCCACR